MSITRLEIGPVGAPLFVFYDHDNSLFSAQYTGGVDIIGVRLTVDTAKCVIDYPYTADSAEPIAGPDFKCVVSSDGYVMCSSRVFPALTDKAVPYGMECRIYRRDRLFLKLYKNHLKGISGTQYALDLISATGILEWQKHLGGFYGNTTFGAVLSDIIGDAVPYTISDEVAGIPVQGGYLPYASSRNNVHYITFAYGVMIGRNDDGDMDFRFLRGDIPIQVPSENIYDGGSVQDPDGVTAVDVAEHSYMALASDETVVVYDNTAGSEAASNTFIDFKENAPLHDLTATGSLVIESSGANWAIVSGTGVLSGKKYTHSTRILSIYTDETHSRDKVTDLTKNTMVTVLNSNNVAKRLLEYYSKKRIVKTSFVVTDEKPGDLLSGIDPFGLSMSGFLMSVNGLISTKIKGECELVADYVPTGQGANYSKAYLYTGSGSVDLSALIEGKDNDLIQIVLIGGGHGGYHGADGQAGGQAPWQPTGYGTGGEGGEGGAPGEGGKILTVTLHVNDMPVKTMPYNCGEGGAPDAEGGATVLGSYTSSDGAVNPYGVANIFGGDLYGTPGQLSGVPGGKGNPEGTSVSFAGETWVPGEDGESLQGSSWRSYGGKGGGPAVGANGGKGSSGSGGDNPDGSDYANGGSGGNGATPIQAESSTVFGGGGNGGHGGGGGAGGGPASSDNPWPGDGGPGGKGGLGGKGGPGLMIIYV